MKIACTVIMFSLLNISVHGQGAVDRDGKAKAAKPKTEERRALDKARKDSADAEVATQKQKLNESIKKLEQSRKQLGDAKAKLAPSTGKSTPTEADKKAVKDAAEAVKKNADEVTESATRSRESKKAADTAAKIAEMETESEKSVDNNYLSINSGIYLLNPYRIGESNRLERGDAEAPFFIEFAFNNVWAWNPSRRQDTWENSTSPFFDIKAPLDHMDFQTKLSFFLHNNGDKTTNASTIVGSGDFAAEATLSLNIYQGLFGPSATGDRSHQIFDETKLAQSVSLVVSYSGVTDRQAFDIHHRVLLGAGYKGAFRVSDPDPDNVAKELLYNIQMGYAWIEQTEFLNDNTREIRLTNGDLPDYKLSGGFAVETELYWRITKTSFLFVGARLYADHDPNPWSAHMGVTIAADKIAGLLGL